MKFKTGDKVIVLNVVPPEYKQKGSITFENLRNHEQATFSLETSKVKVGEVLEAELFVGNQNVPEFRDIFFMYLNREDGTSLCVE